MEAAEDGRIRNRSGDRYKPSTLRGYEQALREYVYPTLGGAKLQNIRPGDVQRLADTLVGRGLKPSTVRNALLPLRAICRRSLRQGDLRVNPTIGLEIPAVRNRRRRVVTPAEAQTLIQAAPAEDQALWATAFYAGLRRGELQALQWSDVDLARGVIRVERSWDQKQGVIPPKSAAGQRRVPIAAVLRDYLVARRMSAPQALVFARGDGTPFSPATISQRAARAWNRAVLHGVTLHECRHTFATLMIAAGVNAKSTPDVHGALVHHGHSRSIWTSFPWLRREQAAVLLDAYLAEAHARAREAEIQACGKTVGKTTPV